MKLFALALALLWNTYAFAAENLFFISGPHHRAVLATQALESPYAIEFQSLSKEDIPSPWKLEHENRVCFAPGETDCFGWVGNMTTKAVFSEDASEPPVYEESKYGIGFTKAPSGKAIEVYFTQKRMRKVGQGDFTPMLPSLSTSRAPYTMGEWVSMEMQTRDTEFLKIRARVVKIR